MQKFVEFHMGGKKTLVNIDWIEEVREEEDGGCTIYIAFTSPDNIDQDHIRPDECYEEVRMKITYAAIH